MKKYIYKFYLRLFYFKRKYEVFPEQILKGLLKSQYWDRTKIEANQLHLINNLILDANEKSDYYNRKAGEQEDYYNSLKEFVDEFPRLTKDLVIKNKESFINHSEVPRFKHTTSGSTGKPMEVEISRSADVYRVASRMRFLNWWGVNIDDNNVLIWRTNNRSKIPYWHSIKNWMRNQLLINIFDLNESTIGKYFKKIEEHKPVYIRGYKSGIYQLARLMESKDLKFRINRLKVVIVTAEILLESERKFMEKIFQRRVANEYGSSEAGLFAIECPKGNMHVNEESVFINSDNNKNVIVTELYNNAMPLINYVNNDRILLSDKFCICGRTSRIIERIEGRIDDFVKCTNGSEKSHLIFHLIFAELQYVEFEKSIKQFRVTQIRFDFLVEIIPGENFCHDVVSYVRRRMFEEIGDEIQIEVTIVTNIEREKSGKLRVFYRK